MMVSTVTSMETDMSDIKKGDVIQITDLEHKWFTCLAIADDIKTWGVQAYVIVPDSNGTNLAYIRLKSNEFNKIGKAMYQCG